MESEGFTAEYREPPVSKYTNNLPSVIAFQEPEDTELVSVINEQNRVIRLLTNHLTKVENDVNHPQSTTFHSNPALVEKVAELERKAP